jgi:peptidoglycan/LPS O-acetylase OafA/YrhL
MGHLWSLTIEEQFYLVWPALVRWAFRRSDARRRLLGWCALGALVAFGLSVLAAETGRRDMAYFGTPTRMFGLLLGAAIAIDQQLPARDTALSARRLLDHRATALGAIVVIVGLSLGIPDASRPLVPLGSVATAACAAVLVRYLVTFEQAGRNWFANGWLRWCGTRSYALYLWDAPAVFVCERIFGVSFRSGAISAVAAFGCAHLSWILVERRFLSKNSPKILPMMSVTPVEVTAR